MSAEITNEKEASQTAAPSSPVTASCPSPSSSRRELIVHQGMADFLTLAKPVLYQIECCDEEMKRLRDAFVESVQCALAKEQPSSKTSELKVKERQAREFFAEERVAMRELKDKLCACALRLESLKVDATTQVLTLRKQHLDRIGQIMVWLQELQERVLTLICHEEALLIEPVSDARPARDTYLPIGLPSEFATHYGSRTNDYHVRSGDEYLNAEVSRHQELMEKYIAAGDVDMAGEHGREQARLRTYLTLRNK
mmetsp:Transcript_52335/g.131452  ORF Transcript_52335/g.131452 Transcript_52335/m.131452 type:complete len:254 (+) Transcript_52335:115-876(+)|eukprot:CAMPEP_0177652370 /NCGR_PEP_ID=MMETSP0447-20121125/13085_1 /TAXON_ID=0 /ORGANISM="Stygamoeba regulata, Strain BSH-02190019" /LENGTH=253 /DNA_ID=CAMNT_0019155593 /DNA_START=106 /DNA_END=867 /DNA_ORIENTATION=+